ncbi:MAG: hypothetical protein ACYDBZ_16515 [Steroidobacteraceae bacterium]
MSEDVPPYGSERDALVALDDLAAEVGQSAIEVIVSEDVLAHLPVIKGAVTMAKLVTAIRDRFLLRKLDTFLRRLASISQEDRVNMIRRLEDDPAYTETVGERLIELLDRLEGQRKAATAGDAFASFARKEIDLNMLRRLLHAVDRLPAMEIDTVRRFVNSGNNQPERDLIDQESIQALMNAGLASSGNGSPIGGGRNVYHENATCLKFIELDLDVKSNSELTVRS